VYLDLDGKDKLALHLLQSLKEKWWLMPDLSNRNQFDNASIGRVVVDAITVTEEWGMI
jgi:predicted GNAT family N-acyltransferase